MTNPDPLEKILSTLFHSYSPTNETLAIAEAKQALNAYFLKQTLELIDKDEMVPPNVEEQFTSDKNEYIKTDDLLSFMLPTTRNDLRAQLRTKATKLYGGR